MILVKPRKPEQIKKNQWAWASIFASAQSLASLATFWVLFTIQIEQLVAAAFPGPSSRELTCFRARNEFNANYHKNDISRAMCAKRIDESCEGRGRNTKGNDVESEIKDIDFKPTDKDREAERISDERNRAQSDNYGKHEWKIRIENEEKNAFFVESTPSEQTKIRKLSSTFIVIQF